MKKNTVIFILLLLSGVNICLGQTRNVQQDQAPLWQAKWIGIGYPEEPNSSIPQYFKKEFSTTRKIKKATLYATARGLYEASLNGKRIGDLYFTPGWTSYNTRIQYQKYDLTSLILKGNNTIQATLGNGWYRGPLAWDKENMAHFGNKLGLLFQLELTYANGEKQLILSDLSWKSAKGESTYAEIYHGETIDHRITTSEWLPVTDLGYDYQNLIAQENEPVRKQEVLAPKKIFTTPKGETVIDFGQELTGWVILKARGPEGTRITIDHGEVLDKAGNFYRDNIRGARAQANYILSGKGLEVFEPHFTFYGFRYIKLTGYPGELRPENFSAVVLHSDMKPTGTFACSDTLINKLQHNIVWGQKGNFLDVPTDCPQRDERLGWTGDAQAFFRTATFNYDVKRFFTKWMRDLRADQGENGCVPFVVPDVLGLKTTGAGGSSGWSDVATIIPWQLYQTYGDKQLLAEQYPTMKGWVDYMVARMDKRDLFNVGFHFGDWLSYRPSDDNGTEAVTDKAQISQCFFAHSTQNLINAARELGNTQEVAKYTALLERIKAAFLKEYMTGNGRLMSNTQTAYVLALHFDMLPEDRREQAVAYLVDNIARYDMHLTTGFLGTPYLCHVLSRFGKADVAYTLLTQKTYPSWLYPVTMGATTIWERWNGIKPDGEFYHPLMNSFNHYAYGAIGDWMYQNVLGIQAGEPGYRKIVIKPLIGGGLTWAKGSYQSASGKISSAWQLQGKDLVLEVEIPSGTTAEVYVPGDPSAKQVGPGKHQFKGRLQ